ncbi:Zinc finger transcription factor-like protein [Emericellopsis cladophorae]|uniref:Zinc finger transcription factor-like protein n=1 Tax=Emericellopsis cladophorae TaxID=2686198 RepID=A0A9P9XZF4_9HYPO|nr:Zinc finger transcription factor-like protein [Emericellopsis cladophorae]KAI6780134.1 Zinc finger transcription factor-like protein [Emericellopsis cladophorae]
MSLANPRRRSPGTALLGEDADNVSTQQASILLKGATFHAPTSPTPADEQTFLPPSLPRAQTHLDDAVGANQRRIELALNDIEDVLDLDKLTLSTKDDNKFLARDENIPIRHGFLQNPIVDPVLAKQQQRVIARPRSPRRISDDQVDSGLGSSIASSDEEVTKKNKKSMSAVAITRSAASLNRIPAPTFSKKAISRIHEHIVLPLLERESLKDFRPIVIDVPRRISSKEIVCLRDLEKTLLYSAPDKAKSGIHYLDFCLSSVRCIQATVEYLTDREQVRPGDRPFTNGYFLDLKDQILQYGRDLAAAKGDSSMDIDQGEEIKLYGGIAENGRPAELVRVRHDGTAVSMATGKEIDIGEGPVQFKRSASQQREDEEEIMRSMARRKKNASPEELAPKRCREPGCTKEFKRPCDLTKHEKTHSRPWKCPFSTCKYHEFGWPTEKEMDRHVNDKHSDKPAMFECQFKPCAYKSKRESNCKQHMEKAHGWAYVRTKTNGTKKVGGSVPPQAMVQTPSSMQQTPPLANASTPSDAHSVATPPQDPFVGHPGHNDFTSLHPQSDADWMASYGIQTEALEGMDHFDQQLSPSSAASYEQFPPYQNGAQFLTDEEIYAATARMPHQQVPLDGSLFYGGKLIPHGGFQVHQPQILPQMPMPSQHHHQQMQTYGNAQQFHAVHPSAPAPHFSPNAKQNPMFCSPPNPVDDGYEETFHTVDGGDFELLPVNMGKSGMPQSLFQEAPSADLGFSQVTEPEIFRDVDVSQMSQMDFQHHFHP